MVKHGEPHGRGSGVGPVDTVTALRGNIETIARTQKAGLRLVGKAKPSGAGKQQDPLAFGLIVPETGRAGLTEGDDPLNAQPGPRQQLIDAFGGAGIGQRTEEVHIAASTPATARRHPA